MKKIISWVAILSFPILFGSIGLAQSPANLPANFKALINDVNILAVIGGQTGRT